tara:strand:+ start:35 stop:973 length:939 start_codon:yes stop_codon:yes gene_type:complete
MNFKFSNLKKFNNFFYIFDIFYNFLKLYMKKKTFNKSNVFFVFSIVNIIPILLGISLKKKIIWYIIEKPDKLFYSIFKILNYFYKIEVVCICKSIAQQLKQKKYKVYFPAINNSFWKNTKKTNNKKINLTCVGNINHIKNHLQLIFFLQEAEINYNLNIVGKKLDSQKKYYSELRSKINKINLDKKNFIKIHNNKGPIFIKKMLEKTDIYILPSKSEGMSISLAEAMSMNQLCMVSNLSNHSKLILHKVNGFEFKLEKRSFIKIFKEIILLDEQKLKNIKKQARKTILDVVEKNKVFEINFKNMFFSNLRSN